MPIARICAIASGGICGMFAMVMLVETFQSPAFPCSAKAAKGMAAVVSTIPQKSNFLDMSPPSLAVENLAQPPRDSQRVVALAMRFLGHFLGIIAQTPEAYRCGCPPSREPPGCGASWSPKDGAGGAATA